MVDMNKMRGKRDPAIARAKEMAEEIASDVGNNGIDLNDWEETFMESINDQLDRGRSLSEAQMEKLTEIWDKI